MSKGGIWRSSRMDCVAYVPLAKVVPFQIRLHILEVSAAIYSMHAYVPTLCALLRAWPCLLLCTITSSVIFQAGAAVLS